MCKITVVKMGQARGEYIGRAGKGSAGSPLANPRRLGDPKPGGGVWNRGDTIDMYRTELRAALDRSVEIAFWGYERDHATPRRLREEERTAMRVEMNRLYQLAKKGELTLVCFCAPFACHGDGVKELLEEKMG